MTHLNGTAKKKRLAIDDEIPSVGPEMYILRLKAEQRYTLTIYSEQIRGIWIHWNQAAKMSEPHYEPSQQCTGCMRSQPKRWKGFLHVFAHELNQQVFMELTPASARSLKEQLAACESLRGNRVQVKRGKGDNSRLHLAILTRVEPNTNLPEAKDPTASILKLWGFTGDTDPPVNSQIDGEDSME